MNFLHGLARNKTYNSGICCYNSYLTRKIGDLKQINWVEMLVSFKGDSKSIGIKGMSLFMRMDLIGKLGRTLLCGFIQIGVLGWSLLSYLCGLEGRRIPACYKS